MAVFKITYLFEAQKQGWSESWYSDTSLSIYDVRQRAIDAIVIRSRLLGDGSRIVAVRVSNIDRFRDSLVTTFDVAGQGIQGDPRDNPGSAYLIRVEAGPYYRRSMYLRGAPDGWIKWNVADGKYDIDGAMTNGLAAWTTVLDEEDWGLQAISTDPNDVNETPILEIKESATNNNVQITTPNFAIAPGDRIRLATIKGSNVKKLNGVHRVRAVVNADTVILYTPWQTNYENNYLGEGVVRRTVYIYPIVTYMTPIRPGTRKTGRAFFVPAGRRSAKK